MMSSGHGIAVAHINSLSLRFPVQNGSGQHSSMEREGTFKAPLLAEKLLAVGCHYSVGETHLPLWVGPLAGYLCPSGWHHT